MSKKSIDMNKMKIVDYLKKNKMYMSYLKMKNNNYWKQMKKILMNYKMTKMLKNNRR